MSSRVNAIIPAGAGLTFSRRSTALEECCSTQTTGANALESRSIGTASASARSSAFCSATAFGTSSPTTTLRYVRMENEITNATPRGRNSKYWETSGSPTTPRAMLRTVIPTWTVEMKRTGSSIIRSAVLAARLPLLRALLEAGAARGDERVLGGDEDRVAQHEHEDGDGTPNVAHRVSLTEKVGAPLPGARVLGGSSPSTQAEV